MALVAASAVYLAILAALTLGPQPEGAGGVLAALADWFSGWPPTAWLTYPVLEFAANIVLFLPAGVLWVLWTGPRRWWIAFFVGMLLSAGIEATQAAALPDRFPDARDLVANTLGAGCGALAMAVVATVVASRRDRLRPRG